MVDAYNEQEPTPRDVMRHRIDDHLILGLPIVDTCRRGVSCDIEVNDLYSEAEIDSLPNTPEARPWNIERQQARIAEITAEWDRWTEECGALSGAALDHLAGTKGADLQVREAQFQRFRVTIERLASDLFDNGTVPVRIFAKHAEGRQPRRRK